MVKTLTWCGEQQCHHQMRAHESHHTQTVWITQQISAGPLTGQHTWTSSALTRPQEILPFTESRHSVFIFYICLDVFLGQWVSLCVYWRKEIKLQTFFYKKKRILSIHFFKYNKKICGITYVVRNLNVMKHKL